MQLDYLLIDACRDNQAEAVKIMLASPDVDVRAMNNRGETTLHIAVDKGNVYIARLLLEHNAPTELLYDNGESLIYRAAVNNIHMLNALIQYNADVNYPNRNGETPLIFAVKSKRKSLIDLLMQNGADSGLKDKLGCSALDYARVIKRTDIIENNFIFGTCTLFSQKRCGLQYCQ